MFGYININRKQLSEDDYHTYQSYYCGLCQTLKKNCGARGQMLLNYDMTFLIVLLTGLYEPQDEQSETFTCAVHPAKKRKYCINAITDYAADMNIILAYHNLIDDWKDDRNYAKKKIADMIKSDYEAAVKRNPRQAEAVETYMEKLAAYEESQERNIDLVAGLTGEMLGEIFAWKQDEWYDEIKTLGMYMGKFIYMMDAYEDLEKDEKSKSYNPLISLKEEHGDNFETLCRLMMTSLMSECAKSFERLPILLHAEILRNVLYSGVWCKYEYIQMKRKKRTGK